MRWSILWRTLILSALDSTLYQYCRYLRELDLRDLSQLLDRLDEPKFRTKVMKQFFAGSLSRFHHVIQTTGKHRATRLDAKKILNEIGDLMTQQAPMLEVISEPTISDVLSTALPLWAPRLSNLRELELWDGKALEGEETRDLLHVYCPKLHRLRIHHSSGSEPDHYLAGMVGTMALDVLTSFENLGTCNIGPETCLAFNNHGQSLTALKLALDQEGILSLGLLQGCTRLQTLHISAIPTSVDLKTTQNDAYLEILEWLKQCGQLTHIYLNNMVSAPDLLLTVLLNEDVKLESLEVNGNESSMYQAKDHAAFHTALGTQTTLQSLSLRGDPVSRFCSASNLAIDMLIKPLFQDDTARDDIELILNSLCRLTNLRELSLYRISDYFSDEHIKLLAQHLSSLEMLYIGGYGISDDVWIPLSALKTLKSITFAGITTFTKDGILGFIEQLGESNTGLVLSIEMADPDTMIPEETQDLLRDAISTKARGRFEYQPLRGTLLTAIVFAGAS